MERRGSAAALVASILILAGCGPGEPPAADAAPGGLQSASLVCGGLPDYALLYVDAVVAACSTRRSVLNPAQESGKVVYRTQAPPAELLAWYRDQTEIKGLTAGPASDTGYSASDGARRTVAITAAAGAYGTEVTVDWTRHPGA